VIDCYEIKIEKPSNLLAKLCAWSQYKQSNTVKELIAIAPQGLTTFISKSWGGRVSDKHLTMECGILEKLLPGDIALAYRSFDISEAVAMVQASLQIPSFRKGKAQLSPTDIEKTRKLANVRIHIERVISTIRQQFQILMSTIPIQYLQTKLPGKVPTLTKLNVCAVHSIIYVYL